MEKGFPPPSIIIFFFLALQCRMQDPSSPTWDLEPSALEAWLLNHWTAREVYNFSGLLGEPETKACSD